MLVAFPDIGATQVAAASACTTAKTVCFAASLILGVSLAAAHLLRRLIGRAGPG